MFQGDVWYNPGRVQLTCFFAKAMRTLIYGGGSVGLGIASCLLKAAGKVDIVARQPTLEHLREKGLRRTGIFGRFHTPPVSFGCCCNLDQLQQKPYDYILICTKSYDSAYAAADLARHRGLFGAQTKIVLFQNGWSNAETFTRHFEREQVYNARVITGFRRTADDEVVITVHADAVHIGSLFGFSGEAVRPLCDAIKRGDIPCETTISIEKDLWAKMLYNCALNPLGAIFKMRYGQLAQNQLTRNLMNEIVTEIFAVMDAAGYRTHWTSADGFLRVFYDRLIPPTAQHESSMLQDILAGRKTEIEALNGAVIKLAEKHNVPADCNRTVYHLVRIAEHRCNE